jgi:hypothetical protein
MSAQVPCCLRAPVIRKHAQLSIIPILRERRLATILCLDLRRGFLKI